MTTMSRMRTMVPIPMYMISLFPACEVSTNLPGQSVARWRKGPVDAAVGTTLR